MSIELANGAYMTERERERDIRVKVQKARERERERQLFFARVNIREGERPRFVRGFYTLMPTAYFRGLIISVSRRARRRKLRQNFNFISVTSLMTIHLTCFN